MVSESIYWNTGGFRIGETMHESVPLMSKIGLL